MSTDAKSFKVESFGKSGVSSNWINKLTDKDCIAIDMTIPPEFEGPGGTYSPEDQWMCKP